MTQKMKGMMKSATENLERYERIKYEMRRLEVGIIKKMNDMELFYSEHPFSDTNPKPHLEKDVINLYNANKKRIEKDGIETRNLTNFMKNSDRKELERNQKFNHDFPRTQPFHTKENEDEYDPRHSRSESTRKYEKESAINREPEKYQTWNRENDLGERDASKENVEYNDYAHKRDPDTMSRYEYNI